MIEARSRAWRGPCIRRVLRRRRVEARLPRVAARLDLASIFAPRASSSPASTRASTRTRASIARRGARGASFLLTLLGRTVRFFFARGASRRSRHVSAAATSRSTSRIVLFVVAVMPLSVFGTSPNEGGAPRGGARSSPSSRRSRTVPDHVPEIVAGVEGERVAGGTRARDDTRRAQGGEGGSSAETRAARWPRPRPRTARRRGRSRARGRASSTTSVPGARIRLAGGELGVRGDGHGASIRPPRWTPRRRPHESKPNENRGAARSAGGSATKGRDDEKLARGGTRGPTRSTVVPTADAPRTRDERARVRARAMVVIVTTRHGDRTSTPSPSSPRTRAPAFSWDDRIARLRTRATRSHRAFTHENSLNTTEFLGLGLPRAISAPRSSRRLRAMSFHRASTSSRRREFTAARRTRASARERARGVVGDSRLTLACRRVIASSAAFPCSATRMSPDLTERAPNPSGFELMGVWFGLDGEPLRARADVLDGDVDVVRHERESRERPLAAARASTPRSTRTATHHATGASRRTPAPRDRGRQAPTKG